MTQVFQALTTARVAASTTAKRIAVPDQTANFRVFNNTAVVAYIQFGASDVVAAAPASDSTGSSFPIAPYATENFRRWLGSTHISIILASGSGDVFVTAGDGV